MLSGPAGTGKSWGLMQKLHLCMCKYQGARGLIVRQTRVSLTQTAMKTFSSSVIHPLDDVYFHGGDQEYRYPDGSTIAVAGLDKPTKILSADFDMIYVQQAEELSEDGWEHLTTRLRNGVMPYQQLLGDCNPATPFHWLKRRADKGQTAMLESRHENNPALHDGHDWTPAGLKYIAKLDALTGVRKLRLRNGIWAAAEGMVYGDEWDAAIHLINRFDVPASWRRFRVVDFGFTNPFTCQWWAIDPDGRLYMYRELYKTQTLVSEHAKVIKSHSVGERIETTIADHDAEDRATLHEAGIPTQAAEKAVSRGIQSVQERMQVQRDGKPRLFIMRDSLIERDEDLADAAKPYCLQQEIDGYVWHKDQEGKANKEEPVKLDDHGCDAMRYAVMYVTDTGLPYQYRTRDPAFRTEVLGPGRELTEEEKTAKRIADYEAARRLE